MNNDQPQEISDDSELQAHWSDNLPWFLIRIIALGCIVMAVIAFVQHP